MLYFEAIIFLAIGGFLFRLGLNKRGEKAAFILNTVGIIAMVIFVLMAFRACQESTNPDNKGVDERIETPGSE